MAFAFRQKNPTNDAQEKYEYLNNRIVMSQDNLKDIFNDAFAAESIPFDNAAWQEMNNLLIAQRRRKLLFGWLTGSAIALAVLGGLYLFLTNAKESYTPRYYNYSFEKFETKPITTELASLSAVTSESANLSETAHPSLEEKSSSTKTSVVNAQSQKDEVSSAASIKSQPVFTAADEVSEPEPIIKTITAQSESKVGTEPKDVLALESTQSAGVITSSEAEQAIPTAISLEVKSIDQLKLMPMVTLENNSDPIAFEDRTIPNLESKKSLNTYLSIGFSKSFDKPASLGFSRWGQRGGIGATYQLRNNLLLAAELNIARDMVNYEEVSNRTEYGYQKYEFEQTVRVKEMLLTEIPILVYYRQNRLMVGTGIKLGYLLSSRIEEENSETVTIKDVGFANWKDLNSMRISVPIDVNYQLNQTYFVGCRYHYGLNDVFDRTSIIDRNNRFDLYLKMNLIR